MEYNILEVEKDIHAIVVKSKYDRAMLFCKAQEFYESPNPKFRGRFFSMWDYMRWYSTNNKKGFTYAMDWSGFNIPISIINKCYHTDNPFRTETPYDLHLIAIVEHIERSKGAQSTSQGYLIGTDSLSGDTFEHEVRHAKYITDKKYKTKVDKIIKKLKKNYPLEYNILRNNIESMGYAPNVVDDEIQAYIQDRTTDNDITQGISNENVLALKKLFLSQ